MKNAPEIFIPEERTGEVESGGMAGDRVADLLDHKLSLTDVDSRPVQVRIFRF